MESKYFIPNSKRLKVAIFITILVAISVTILGIASGSIPEGKDKNKPTAVAFHDTWRKLWEDHIIWTRMVIIGILNNVPCIDQAKQRLLQNSDDMENILTPYYGADAANELGDLIEEHLLIAVDILEAAKAGNTTDFNNAVNEWYANADEIAAQMDTMNHKHWPLSEAQAMWKSHLDATLAEINARLTNDCTGDITAFDQVEEQALTMADFFSDGTIRKFENKFKSVGCIKKSK
jgi:hypothetical protein